MKICTKCNTEKDESCFSKDKQKKDGLHSSCKECKKSYDTVYVEQNRDRKYASNLAYNEAHRKEKQEYDRIRRSEHRDVINAKKREYYHSDSGKAKNREWHKTNWSIISASKKNTKHKRRELIRTSTLSGSEFKKWTEDQEKVCTYCNNVCYDSYHVDHVNPLSKGGLHELSNLAISCPSCNSSKGNKSIEEWMIAKSHTEQLKTTKGL